MGPSVSYPVNRVLRGTFSVVRVCRTRGLVVGGLGFDVVEDEDGGGELGPFLELEAELFLDGVEEGDGAGGVCGFGAVVRGGGGAEVALAAEAEGEVVGAGEAGGVDDLGGEVAGGEGLDLLGELGHGHVLAGDELGEDGVVDAGVFGAGSGDVGAVGVVGGVGGLHFGVGGDEDVGVGEAGVGVGG